MKKRFRQPVDTPDGEGGVIEIKYPKVKVLLRDGKMKTYDVDDCMFPETHAR